MASESRFERCSDTLHAHTSIQWVYEMPMTPAVPHNVYSIPRKPLLGNPICQIYFCQFGFLSTPLHQLHCI